jgi:hypothetical protein
MVTVQETGCETGVEAVTMQDILSREHVKRVDLLKIDIEGAGVELFPGDVSWLDNVHAIAVEFHGDSRQQSQFDEIIARYGFRVAESGDHTTVAVRR